MIRKAKLKDIKELAQIYKELFDDADIGECWSIESAENLLNYWYNLQKDLFFVDEEDGKAIGAIMSGIKPWFDGNRLIETELFVAKDYQKNNIGKELFRRHLEEAKKIYQVNVIEFHTYGDENEFPQNWYRKIGFNRNEELIIMSANINEVLEKI